MCVYIDGSYVEVGPRDGRRKSDMISGNLQFVESLASERRLTAYTHIICHVKCAPRCQKMYWGRADCTKGGRRKGRNDIREEGGFHS